jgi:hypothetical protein
MSNIPNMHPISEKGKYDMTTVDEVLVKSSCDFMDKAKKDGKPFFVWHNSTRMHVWTFLAPKYNQMMNSKTNYGLYEAGVAQMDDAVGAILKHLDDIGETENTIFVFTTDNGAEVFTWPDGGMTPFKGTKGTVMEGGFRAPCLIRWPGPKVTTGAGPVFLYPSATDNLLGSEKWGAGPTIVLFKQEGPWTVGLLFNHIWSFAGDDHRNYSSSTFLQPFIAYATKTKTTFTLNTESTYDWHNEQWTVPINLLVSQLIKIGKQPVQLGLGAKIYAEGPSGAPEWGIRFVVTPLFPTGGKSAPTQTGYAK